MSLYLCELCDRYFVNDGPPPGNRCPGCDAVLREATEEEGEELRSLLQQEAVEVFTSGTSRIWMHR